jgi:hypothetical protein
MANTDSVMEQERQLIKRLAAHDPAAGQEFVHNWDHRIKSWISQCAPHEKVEEYAQEVWGHLIEGNWLRLLQWKGLYDDEAWNPHSLEAFLKRKRRRSKRHHRSDDITGPRPCRGSRALEVVESIRPLQSMVQKEGP